MQTNTKKKKNNGLIHIMMQGKVKDTNILKIPPYFWNDKFSFLKAKTVHVQRGKEVT